MAKEISTAEFQQEVIEASNEKLVLVDFWAPWCGPCRAVAPILEELSTELADTLSIVKVNVDENQDIAMTHMVRSIPTMKFFKNGKVVHEILGAMPKEALMAEISEAQSKS